MPCKDSSKPCLDILSKLAGVLWADIVECSAWLGNVREVVDGEADGVCKFGSEEQAKQGQEEFAPIALSLWRRRVASCTTWVRRTAGSLHSSRHWRKVSRWHHFWPQTPPCPCSGLRRLGVLHQDRALVRRLRHRLKANVFGEVSYSELAFLPDVVEYLHVRCFLLLKKKRC